MPGWQIRLRGAVMMCSVLAIVLAGGQAVLMGHPVTAVVESVSLAGQPGAAGPAPSAVRGAASVPAVRRYTSGLARELQGGRAPVTASGRVLLSLSVRKRPDRRTGDLLLRVSALDALGGTVSVPVTLWRQTARGRWTPVITGRSLGAGGTLDLPVRQSGRTAHYRVTSPATGTVSPATSRAITVRRR